MPSEEERSVAWWTKPDRDGHAVYRRRREPDALAQQLDEDARCFAFLLSAMKPAFLRSVGIASTADVDELSDNLASLTDCNCYVDDNIIQCPIHGGRVG